MDQQMATLDQRQAQSTERQTQLELRKADENDRANVAKLMTSINDITFWNSERQDELGQQKQRIGPGATLGNPQ